MKPKDKSRDLLKQILAGEMAKEEAIAKLEKEKPFDLHAAIYTFCDGDEEIMSRFYPDRYPLKHDEQ